MNKIGTYSLCGKRIYALGSGSRICSKCQTIYDKLVSKSWASLDWMTETGKLLHIPDGVRTIVGISSDR